MLADIDGLQVVGQAESGEESLLKARELGLPEGDTSTLESAGS